MDRVTELVQSLNFKQGLAGKSTLRAGGRLGVQSLADGTLKAAGL